jgi:hypothetical protein
MPDYTKRLFLILVVLFQGFTHLFWLSPSTHSGQIAIPWMMNRGRVLFGDIWEQHAPGSSLLGALAQSIIPLEHDLLIKLLNTILVVAITLLVYQLATKLSQNGSAGMLSVLVWVWWEPVYGNVMFYFDTLLALCILQALVVYFHHHNKPTLPQIIIIGLLMGLATLFKQHAWLAVGCFGLWLVIVHRHPRIWIPYGLAVLVIPVIQWGLLASQGLLESYVFWNWGFNLSGYMDGVPLDGDFFRKLLLSNLLVFPFMFIALRRENRRYLLLVLMWLATLTVLYPRFGEIHGMGHLPFMAVMSGMVLAWLIPDLNTWRTWDIPRQVIAGLAIAIGIGWFWTGAVSYIPTQLGAGAVLAYDEFRGLVAELQPLIDTDDTLFVLPETDSTPQLHPMTGMMPPTTWIKGWNWYFEPDFVLPTLHDNWDSIPPTWVIVFPDLVASGTPGITQLLERVEAQYSLTLTVDEVFLHGVAEVYRLDG